MNNSLTSQCFRVLANLIFIEHIAMSSVSLIRLFMYDLDSTSSASAKVLNVPQVEGEDSELYCSLYLAFLMRSFRVNRFSFCHKHLLSKRPHQLFQ